MRCTGRHAKSPSRFDNRICSERQTARPRATIAPLSPKEQIGKRGQRLQVRDLLRHRPQSVSQSGDSDPRTGSRHRCHGPPPARLQRPRRFRRPHRHLSRPAPAHHARFRSGRESLGLRPPRTAMRSIRCTTTSTSTHFGPCSAPPRRIPSKNRLRAAPDAHPLCPVA